MILARRLCETADQVWETALAGASVVGQENRTAEHTLAFATRGATMFWQRARHVREVLLTASRPDSTLYALVSYDDGGLGIARDGEPLVPFYWPASDEIDECITVFMRLAGLEPRRTHLSTN